MIELVKENKIQLTGDNFPNIVKGYYDYFEENEREREIKDIPTFAPSYLTSCGRQLYYKKTGQEPSNPIDLPSRFKMYLGTLAHEGLQTIMKSIGNVVESEVHHNIEYDGLEFNYFIDLVIEYKGEKIVIEIKTIYGRGFDFIKDRPKEDHLLQLLSYMYFSKITKGIILYCGRDNGYMIQHNIELEEIKGENRRVIVLNDDSYIVSDFKSKWVHYIKRLKDIKQQIIDKKIPEPDYKRLFKVKNGVVSTKFQHNSVKYSSPWQCEYCSFRDLCQPAPEKEGIYV